MPEEKQTPIIATGGNSTDAGSPPPNGKPRLSFLQSLLQKRQTEKTPQTEGNVFTRLFGVKEMPREKTVMASPPKAQQTQSAPPSISSLLGQQPEAEKKLAETVEKENQKLSRIAKTVFVMSALIAAATYGYFYSQLNADFTLFADQLGSNTAQQFESSNSELQKIQTEYNILRYRLVRTLLDGVNGQADSYQRLLALALSTTAAPVEKENAKNSIATQKERIVNALREVQKIFASPLGLDTFSTVPITPAEREKLYESLMQSNLENQRNVLGTTANLNSEEIRSLDSIIRLVENSSLRTQFKSYDFGKITDMELTELLRKIREQGNDELSSLDAVRNKRLDWAVILQDIAAVTRKADLYYGQGLFKTVGGFLFNSYTFDAISGKINVSGATKTSDSKTFSFIAKLIDSIEKSPKFKDVDFRSFSKTRDPKGDYSASVNLLFSLQTGPDPRDDISLTTP